MNTWITRTQLNLLERRFSAFLCGLIASIVLVQSYGHFHQAQHFEIRGQQAQRFNKLELSHDDSDSGSELHDCALLDAVTLSITLINGRCNHTNHLDYQTVQTPLAALFFWGAQAVVTPPARAPPVSV